MSNYPLPNFNVENPKFILNDEEHREDWMSDDDEEDDYRDYPLNNKSEFPGWENPWPDLPDPDVNDDDFSINTINLRVRRNPCGRGGVLGYYMSWHIVGVSFRNENGREPYDGKELKRYNDALPEENRHGIHICCNTIESYVECLNTYGIDPSEINAYKEYCTYLMMIYVIAHEWGHYRSEVLSFQIGNVCKAVTGEGNSPIAPSYLTYFMFKKLYPNTNFEEVFAEWAALKVGVFNFQMRRPAFTIPVANWAFVEATVKRMLSDAINRRSRPRPYRDIRRWVDFEKLTSIEILRRISAGSKGLNQSVDNASKIKGIKSLKKGKMIDLLMHNQLQFNPIRKYNGVVKSAPARYPKNPDSVFYHIGYDECSATPPISEGSKFQVRLGEPVFYTTAERNASRIMKVLNDLRVSNRKTVTLPISVMHDILPLDPVYFHA